MSNEVGRLNALNVTSIEQIHTQTIEGREFTLFVIEGDDETLRDYPCVTAEDIEIDGIKYPFAVFLIREIYKKLEDEDIVVEFIEEFALAHLTKLQHVSIN